MPIESTVPRATVPRATVALSTRNRKDDLRRAVQSALEQTVPLEILVCDDASTDGTPDMIRAEFPTVVLHVSDQAHDVTVQRNRAAELASTDFIISIDDDAMFTSPDTVEQVLRGFDDPRVGAVAMPFINVRVDSRVRQKAPDTTGTYIASSFIGTAYAIRRDVFLDVGGYRTFLVHQYEEEDFCIRMLDAGYMIRLGSTEPIHHFHSPVRNRRGMDIWGARNTVLFTWHNVPMPYFVPHLLGTTVNALAAGVRAGSTLRKVRGVMSGYADCVRQMRERQPVRPATYRLYRRLRRVGTLPISVLESYQ